MYNTQSTSKIADPCVLVIFGITGDLTKRLLYPAICNLGSNGLLNKNFYIIGVSKSPFTTETFREKLIKDINEFITDPAAKKFGLQLVNRVSYISGDLDDDNVYAKLDAQLAALHKEKASKSALFYFATPPKFIQMIATGLSKAQLLTEKEGHYFRRIIVEKPFGHDLASAKNLNKILLGLMEEQQIFRIDHFLGKETVQNLLAFRFSNGLFEPIWSHLYIDHVQITVAEKLGIEQRGRYYDHAGALRDMVPNHMLQLLSLITMEPPASFQAKHIQAEKEKALYSIQIMAPEQVLQQAVRGQYAAGHVDKKKVRAYREETHVDPHSNTETYVALKLFLDNWRWYQVPIYLRTGKRMEARTSEIIIQFRSGPSHLFSDCKAEILPNILRIRLQPDAGISIYLNAKVPGPTMRLDQVGMTFNYSDFFNIKATTGYESILYDCIQGEHLLFKHAATVEASWAVVQPILDVWSALKPRDFPNYAPGSLGPDAAQTLMQQDGRRWIL